MAVVTTPTLGPLTAYEGFPDGVEDSFCQHAVKNATQYGTTARALAAEVLKGRAEVASLTMTLQEIRAQQKEDYDRADLWQQEAEHRRAAVVSLTQRLTDQAATLQQFNHLRQRCQVKQHWSRVCEFGTKACNVRHLRTADDEQAAETLQRVSEESKRHAQRTHVLSDAVDVAEAERFRAEADLQRVSVERDDLEQRCDPAGDLRARRASEENAAALVIRAEQAEADLQRLTEERDLFKRHDTAVREGLGAEIEALKGERDRWQAEAQEHMQRTLTGLDQIAALTEALAERDR